MLRSILRGLALLISGLLLLTALSPRVQRKLDQNGFIPALAPNGDLYQRTFLRQFREENFVQNKTLTEADKPVRRSQNVDLYTMGDSFTEIDTSFYAGRRNAHVWLTFTKATANLDRSKKNILVIEVLERLIQQRLHVKPDSTVLIQQGLTDPDTTASSPAKIKPPTAPAAGVPMWLTARFGSDINYRLEMLFFNSESFVWFKELRAQVLYSWFNRIPAGAVSRDRQHLFYDLEVDTTYDTSAFRRLSASNMDSVVATINHTRDHYRQMGFNEVYFSFSTLR